MYIYLCKLSKGLSFLLNIIFQLGEKAQLAIKLGQVAIAHQRDIKQRSQLLNDIFRVNVDLTLIRVIIFNIRYALSLHSEPRFAGQTIIFLFMINLHFHRFYRWARILCSRLLLTRKSRPDIFHGINYRSNGTCRHNGNMSVRCSSSNVKSRRCRASL